MGAQGLAEVDFGAHPGAVEKELAVATVGVVVTSLVEAWLVPDATTDHNVDEHIAMMDSLRVQARYTADDSITIRVQPVLPQQGDNWINGNDGAGRSEPGGAQRQLTYGKWSIGWVWN